MVKIESFCGELKSKGTLHPIAGLMVIFCFILRGLDCSRIKYSCSMLFYEIFVFGNDVILVSLVSLRPYHAFRIVNPEYLGVLGPWLLICFPHIQSIDRL